jgi:hypothetical protein
MADPYGATSARCRGACPKCYGGCRTIRRLVLSIGRRASTATAAMGQPSATAGGRRTIRSAPAVMRQQPRQQPGQPAAVTCSSRHAAVARQPLRQPPCMCDSRHVRATAAAQSGREAWVDAKRVWGSALGATAEGPSSFAGGGDAVNEAMAAAWLRFRLGRREREKAGARGAGTMAVWGTNGRRSGLPSEAQHRCGGTKSTGLLGFGSHLGISAVRSAVTCGSHVRQSHSAVTCDRLRQSHRQSQRQ